MDLAETDIKLETSLVGFIKRYLFQRNKKLLFATGCREKKGRFL